MKKDYLQRYYGNDRAAKVIYGAILIYAYLLGQSHSNNDSALYLFTGTLFAAIAIVVAEIYAEIIGKTIKNKKSLNKHERLEIEKDAIAIISVSLWPSIIFLLSYFGLLDVSVAFNISYALMISILMFFSYFALRISNHSKTKSIIYTSVITIIGIGAVLLKYYVGH